MMTTRKLLMTTLTTAGVIVGSIIESDFIDWQRTKQLDERYEQTLNYVQELKKDKQYSTCMYEAQKVPSQSSWYNEAQKLWFGCQDDRSAALLEKARVFANQGHYKHAITTAKQIPEGKFHETAQQLINEWSFKMLKIADAYYATAIKEFKNSCAVIHAIPKDSPAYFQVRMKSWFDSCQSIT